MTLTTFTDNSELFRACVCWFTGYSETNLGFPILPSGVTVTPSGTWTNDLSLGNNKSCKTFDGSTNYITVGTVSTFNFLHQVGTTGKWTVAFWYRYTNRTSTVRILSSTPATTGYPGIYAHLSASRVLSFGIAADTTTVCTSWNVQLSDDSNWHQLVITYDQSLASGNMLTYLDSILVATDSKTANTPSTADAYSIMRIGQNANGTNPMAGNLKDLMFFQNRILNQVDITTLFRLTAPGGRDLVPVMSGVRGVE